MEFPVTLGLSDTSAPMHYVFETVAFFTGVRLYYHHRRSSIDHISDTGRLWVMLGAVLGALIGSRFIAWLEDPAHFASYGILELFGNKTLVGGFLGGLLGVESVKKVVGIRSATGDVYVLPIIVAVFIGRIGCFLSGISEPTFGIPSQFFMAMDLGDGILRHPVALYEMIYMVVLFAFFYKIRHRKIANGERFKLFMLCYFSFRFAMEFLKPYHPLYMGLSIIHLSALFIVLYYFRFIGRILTRIIR